MTGILINPKQKMIFIQMIPILMKTEKGQLMAKLSGDRLKYYLIGKFADKKLVHESSFAEIARATGHDRKTVEEICYVGTGKLVERMYIFGSG